MKKTTYIAAFMLLGVLLQQLVHSLLEIFYIDLLLNNFKLFSFGTTWSQLLVVHQVLTFMLLLFGLLFGFYEGKYWWKRIYEKKK